MQARYFQIGAILLFALLTFAFLTCDIYLRLSSGRAVSFRVHPSNPFPWMPIFGKHQMPIRCVS